jgi:hypothetical protein
MSHTKTTSPAPGPLELLDALDVSVAELRARLEAFKNGTIYQAPCATGNGNGAHRHTNPQLSPERLRISMELAGLDRATISTVFGVSSETIGEWLSGKRPIPSWVLPSIRILELLTPAARRNFIRNPAVRAGRKSVNSHPFSHIDEL